MKKEARILTYKLVECSLRKYTIYAVLRGVKGFEHVGVVEGGLEALIEFLKNSRIYDEIRVVREVEELVSSGDNDIVKHAEFMNSLVNEILKYLC